MVFDISKKSIERVEVVTYKNFNKIVTLLEIDEDDSLIIQTKSHYKFHESFKNKIREHKTFAWIDNTPDCIMFEFYEMESFGLESEIEDREIPFEVRIYLNKDSEWYYCYIDALKKTINGYMKNLQEKLKKTMTLDAKGMIKP